MSEYGRDPRFHAWPDDDGDETLLGVVSLRALVTVATDGTPRRIAHGADDTDPAFEGGKATGAHGVLAIGSPDGGDERFVIVSFGAVFLDFFARRLDRFAKMDVRVDAAESDVSGIGEFDTVGRFSSEIDLEGFSGTANDFAFDELPGVEVNVLAVKANGFA